LLRRGRGQKMLRGDPSLFFRLGGGVRLHAPSPLRTPLFGVPLGLVDFCVVHISSLTFALRFPNRPTENSVVLIARLLIEDLDGWVTNMIQMCLHPSAYIMTPRTTYS
jgi:hypothetical protein